MPRKPLQLLLALACSTPLSAVALGVGQIQVRSALNQVLDAEIPLLLAGPAEAAGVTARLAPAQVFAQNSVERPALLTELVFSVHTGADGRGFIKVTSKQPIREPLLDFLIQVDWPKGQVMREFAVLLDPPARVARRLAMPPVTQPPQPDVPARPPVTHRGTATYGPVPFGETLWNIASRVRPDPAIRVQRMLQVLLDANPRAFWKRNVDGLRAGATLRIPSAQEIDPVHFPEEVSRQLAARQQVPLATPAAKGTPAPAGKTQVRLVPPEVAEVAEGGQRPAQTATAPPQPGVSPAAPALTVPFAIRLKDNHPTLRLAGLEELRQRMSTLRPQEAAKAAQELQAAPSAKAPEPAPTVVPQPKPPEQAPAVKASEPQPLPEPQQPSPAGGSAPQPEMHLQEALPEALVPRPGTSRETPEGAGTLQPEAGPEPRAPVTRPETAPLPPPVAASTATPPPPPVAASTATPPPVTVPAPVPTPPAKPLPAAQESGSEGLLSDWLEPVRLALLGALSLLLGGGAWYWLQRRSQQEASEETQMFKGITPVPAPATVETAVMPTQATYKQTEPVTRTPPSRVVPNPLERADLLLAVGNYAEADNILRQALTMEPGNTALLAKRLDVHFAAHDTEAFAKEAEVLHEKLKDRADPLWSRVTQMGRELCPGHTLFSGADELFAVAATQTAMRPSGVDTADKVASGEQIDAVFAESDTALFANLAEPAEPPTRRLRDSLAEPDWQLSDLGQPTITSEALPEEEPTRPPAWDDRSAAPHEPDWQSLELDRPTVTTEPLRQDEEKESTPSPLLTPLADLELELDSLFTSETTNSRLSVTPSSADATFTGLEGGETAAGKQPMPALEEPLQEGLDLTPESRDKRPPAAGDIGTLRGEDYVETKLDLAMAYLDMEDAVGARSLLEEVLKEGNDSQKQRAQASIAKLG